jgi:hypothetical protein
MTNANGTVKVISPRINPGKVLTRSIREKTTNKGITKTIAGSIWLVSMKERMAPRPRTFSQTIAYAAGAVTSRVKAEVQMLTIALVAKCGQSLTKAFDQFWKTNSWGQIEKCGLKSSR